MWDHPGPTLVVTHAQRLSQLVRAQDDDAHPLDRDWKRSPISSPPSPSLPLPLPRLPPILLPLTLTLILAFEISQFI